MYLVVQTIINNKNSNIMNNSATLLVLASIECQLSDWSVTTEEDGYTQEYINGRVDGLASAIKTLQALVDFYETL
tara:strand:- start:352 stop:576 length:225 start_codon:yes stop_codon:yes gene_type:complete